MSKKKFIKKLLLIIGIVLAAVLAAAVVAFTVVTASCGEFFFRAVRTAEIPGLDGKFVPQGLEYDGERDIFAISGYMSDSGAAAIHTLHPDGSSRSLDIVTEDGSSFINHAGGIAISGEYAYIAGCDGKCYVLSAKDIANAENKTVQVIGEFPAGNRADYCTVSSGYLFIGEYYHPVKFTTDESHHITTPVGDSNKALMLAFKLGDDEAMGVCAEPEAAFSTTGRIQGACFDGDRVYFSASSTLQGSQLLSYDYKSAQKGTYTYSEKTLDLYYLDNSVLTFELKMPPLSEGITVRDGQLYVIFESAAKKYKYGRLFGAQYMYRLKLPLGK